MSEINKYKPGVPKKTLLFIAAVVWTVAGSILLFRGFIAIPAFHHLLVETIIGLTGGIIFYILVFDRVSKKHINRILKLGHDKPCMFAFFDTKSYLLMIIMIGTSIMIRKLHLVNEEYIFTFFIAMGVPLVLSAIRFYITGFKYKIQQ